MNLEEANEFIKITDEEKRAIQNYLSIGHTGINILASFTPKTYREVSGDWVLPENNEELKADIEEFVNLYSAIYKYFKQSNIRNFVGNYNGLTRGTSDSRLINNSKSQESQFLSTSLDANISKRFCHYNDAALERIRIDDDVPFLYAEDFRSDHRENEEEIIIAPFTKIKLERDSWSQGEYRYYDAKVSAKEIKELPPEENAKLEGEILASFKQHLENLKSYINISDQYSICVRQLNNARGEDVKYLLQRLEELDKQQEEVGEKTSEFSTKLEQYLQSRCAEKVRQYTQANDIIEKDKIAKEEQAKREAEEAKRKSAISGLETNLNNTSNMTRDIIRNITSTYNEFEKAEREAIKKYREFGLQYVPKFNGNRAGARIDEIVSNVRKVQNRLNSIQVDGSASIEDVQQISQQIAPYLSGIFGSEQLSARVPGLLDQNYDQMENELKRELHIKASEVIKNARLQKLQAERTAIENERVGFFGRLLGKQELKEERLANNALRAKILKESSPEEKERYSIKETLAELYACAITDFDGKFTPEMEELYSKIANAYLYNGQNDTQKRSIDEYIRKMAEVKIQREQKENLPVVIDGKKKKNTRTKIQECQSENARLQQKLEEKQMSRRNFGYVSSREETIASFEQELQRIEMVTRNLTIERTQEARIQNGQEQEGH